MQLLTARLVAVLNVSGCASRDPRGVVCAVGPVVGCGQVEDVPLPGHVARRLQRYEVEVLRPRLLTDAEKAAGGSHGYANFFVRDPWFTIGDVVIEGALRFPHRHLEVLPSRRDILTVRALEGCCLSLALPQPPLPGGSPDDSGLGPFLEGGDVLVYDKHVFVGNSGLASNALGARWLHKPLPRSATPSRVCRSRRTFCTSTVRSA